MTLLQRTRAVIASIDDDFYDDEVVVDYLNMSQRRVVSMLNSMERDAPRSLRALDNLRQTQQYLTTGTTAEHSYVKGTITLPQNLMVIQYVEFDNKIPVRELPISKRYQLRWGNAIPSLFEGYYLHQATDRVLTYLLVGADNDDVLDVYYLQRPNDIDEDSTEFTSLPPAFQNAVIYGAAELMSIQENARESQDNALAYRKFKEKFQEEFNQAIF
jgi:hypothetical protein